MEVLYRKHPETGLMVGTDGSVQLPKNERHKAKTTFGCIHPLGYRLIGYNYKTYRVHRLVAETFIPNPENKPEVDHIDRNPANNTLENLRWETRSENQRNRAVVERVTAEGRQHRFGPEYTLQWKGQKQVVFSDGKQHRVSLAEYESLRPLTPRERNWDDVLANRQKKVV